MRSEIAASEERSYRKLKEGALSEVNERLDSIENVLADQGRMIGTIDDELKAFRQDFADFQQRMEP